MVKTQILKLKCLTNIFGGKTIQMSQSWGKPENLKQRRKHSFQRKPKFFTAWEKGKKKMCADIHRKILKWNEGSSRPLSSCRRWYIHSEIHWLESHSVQNVDGTTDMFNTIISFISLMINPKDRISFSDCCRALNVFFHLSAMNLWMFFVGADPQTTTTLVASQMRSFSPVG